MSGRDDSLTASRHALLHELGRERSRVAHAEDAGEGACHCFGYLRGLHERGIGLEVRFRTGNREWFPYSHLASCRFDPSVGLLLKFTGDVVTLVLVHGSNLDLPVNEGAVDLIERGLERHRVLWLRELEEHELRTSGEKEPTIDRIEVAEFETREEEGFWLKANAPAFCRRGD